MKYPPPVSALLTYGDCLHLPQDGPGPYGWPDYPSELGIGLGDVPHLIAMIQDDELNQADEDDLAVWAPTHAWRTLGELQAEEAIESLLNLMKIDRDDDWFLDEIPMVLGLIGQKAIPPVSRILADDQSDELLGILASEALRYIAENTPEVRDLCVEIMTRQLECGSGDRKSVNGFIVNNLVKMNAVEALEPIRKAFGNGSVDLNIVGDLEDVEISLGIRKERSTPRPRYDLPLFEKMPQQPMVNAMRGFGRNDPCPCGSGKKYKRCCLE